MRFLRRIADSCGQMGYARDMFSCLLFLSIDRVCASSEACFLHRHALRFHVPTRCHVRGRERPGVASMHILQCGRICCPLWRKLIRRRFDEVALAAHSPAMYLQEGVPRPKCCHVSGREHPGVASILILQCGHIVLSTRARVDST
jgi:hypothetical protein